MSNVCFLIYRGEPVAYTDEELKSGQWVRVSWQRNQSTLFNLIDCKVSKAKKWLKNEAYKNGCLDFAVRINDDFYAGNDKPEKIVFSDDAIEKGKKIAELINQNETLNDYGYDRLACMITGGFENGRSYTDLQIDLQVIFDMTASESDNVLRLWINE